MRNWPASNNALPFRLYESILHYININNYNVAWKALYFTKLSGLNLLKKVSKPKFGNTKISEKYIRLIFRQLAI